MTKDEFVALCKELLEHGAVEVSADTFRASFRTPAQQHGPRREPPKPDGKPPAPLSAEDARRSYYDRLMGGDGR
jgi:hypothetical protein